MGHSRKILEINPVLDKPLVVLIAGVDQEYDYEKYGYAVKVPNSYNGRTDTLMVLKFDPKTQRLSGLNIPRDTRVFLNGRRPLKINHLNIVGGIDFVERSLEELLNLKIDRHLMVHSDSAEQIIDMVGGIEVEVPQRMSYKDRTDGLQVDLEPGLQVLNGRQAVGFLRFRNTALGDIGRIQRQQIFLRAVQQKLSDPQLWRKAPELASFALESVKTDLSLLEILKLANFSKDLSSEQQIFATLPGEFSEPPPEEEDEEEKEEEKEKPSVTPPTSTKEGQSPVFHSPYQEQETTDAKQTTDQPNQPAKPQDDKKDKDKEKKKKKKEIFVSYWLPHQKEIEALVHKLFHNSTLEAAQAADLKPSQITITLQNATEDPKLLSKMRQALNKEGFRIIDVQRRIFSADAAHTKIYFSQGNPEEALFLKQRLQLSPETKIWGSSTGSPMSSLTITIGEDLKDWEATEQTS